VSVVALLVQFIVAPRLMRVVGIGGALAILPLGLTLGTVGMLVMPGLAAGVLLRGADQSLKHSIDKTGRELLFVPVSLEKKKRVKVFLDLFVDQGAQGIGGALLLLFTAGLGLSVLELSYVMFGLLAVWGGLAVQARRSYVDQFRRKLRHQESYVRDDPDPGTDDDADDDIPSDLNALLKSLCSHNEAQALWALEKLEDSDQTVPVDALLCLMDHPAAAVREGALRVFRVRDIDADGVAQAAAEALTDPDPDVQLAAARYLYCQTTSNHLQRLQEGLQHDDVRIQAAAVGLIASEGGKDELRLITEPMLRRLMDLEGDAGEDARTHVARVLGVLDRPYRNDLLRRLLRDESMQVQRAAIAAAGSTEERAFVHLLIDRLQVDGLREDARQALVAYGRRILGTLHDHLVDTQVPPRVRKEIPSILAGEPCQLGVTVLENSLDRVPLPVRHAAVRALSKLHAAGDFTFDNEKVEAVVRDEAEHYAALGQILQLQLRTQSRDEVDVDVLRAFREESLERIFRLLGLRYDQRDIYDAYLGITSNDESLRSSAVEFVDNLVDYSTSRYLLPLLDDPTGTQAVEAGRRHFDRRIRRWSEADEYLQAADDPRLPALLDGDAAAVPDVPGDGAPNATPEEVSTSAEPSQGAR